MPPKKPDPIVHARWLFRNYKRDAMRFGREFKLCFDEFLLLTCSICHYCQDPPQKRIRAFCYNGIDRMDNEKGYIPGNCVTACWRCNCMKSAQISYAEMVEIGKARAAYRKAQEAS